LHATAPLSPCQRAGSRVTNSLHPQYHKSAWHIALYWDITWTECRANVVTWSEQILQYGLCGCWCMWVLGELIYLGT